MFICNLQLPHTLLSRFDLIFLILDPQDEVYDARLARHLVGLYYRGTASEDGTPSMSTATTLDREDPVYHGDSAAMLRDYIAYAKVGRRWMMLHLLYRCSSVAEFFRGVSLF